MAQVAITDLVRMQERLADLTAAGEAMAAALEGLLDACSYTACLPMFDGAKSALDLAKKAGLR